ncbi:hypothetical protein [Burkholderia lata]|uniref:hypothetical protein n=1 Tax=Burkholderia lata (strain ATCC 17760 / DSM 23089 / LMG 22485 / NCIMB 9086 / R18194 / 383) TaxID=482957 RepID=UPI001452C60A|nr:hypothetical protein [Burkholderia lata]VWB97332.1 hypothetical protein BLA15816_04702 [Burkholderia lata]
MTTQNEKGPAPEQASEAMNQRPGTEAHPTEVVPTAEDILGARAAGGNGTSSKVSRADALTAQAALAAIETFEIVGENNDSREPNDEDRFILTEFIAHAFDGYPAEQHEAAPIGWQLIVQAINAVDKEAARRGEMYPQTDDEQRMDRKAVRRVIEMIEWYATQGGAVAERLDAWPKTAASIAQPEPPVADERTAFEVNADDLDFEPDGQPHLADMANVGHALLEQIKRMLPGYHWNDSPVEVISDLINERDEARGSSPNAAGAEGATFHARVQPWMLACFGAEIAADRAERNHRFLEEALELVQACGCTASEAHQLVDYTFGRPVGDPSQEAGGVMVTLAALCLANGLDMHAAGETELARVWTKVEQIRAKQAAKPKHSPLPEAPAQAAQPVCWIERSQLDQLEDLTSDAWVYWRETGHVAEDDELALYLAPPPPASASAPDDTHRFKNFHRQLCERFGYVHDEIDWRRDQVSLLEWIAKLASSPVVVTDEQILEIGRRHFRPGHNVDAEANFVAAVRDVLAAHPGQPEPICRSVAASDDEAREFLYGNLESIESAIALADATGNCSQARGLEAVEYQIRRLFSGKPDPRAEVMDGWQPIESAPTNVQVVVFWLDPEDEKNPERHDFDILEEECWTRWTNDYEWAHAVAPAGSRLPREQPPYTHWKPLGAPAVDVASAGDGQ